MDDPRADATTEDGRARVVVVGAGFAGLSAVKALAKKQLSVTLVDRNIYSTFQPLLYQVATGGLNPGDVAYPVRTFVVRHGARYRRGSMVAHDPTARTVTLDDGTELGYDYLVVAAGSAVNYFSVPGAAEHAHTIYTRRQATSLRDELLAALESLAASRTTGDVAIVIVGGGATGVELAGSLAELRNGVRGAFPELDPSRLHVVLVEQGDALLAPFAEPLRRYARAQLERRGVEIRLKTSIEAVDEHSVTLAGGETLTAWLTVWAAGVAAPAGAEGWGLAQGPGGRIAVGTDLRATGTETVFAVGDVASCAEAPFPQLAPAAIQSGVHAAHQIVALEAGRPTRAFRYHDKGQMATIGRSAAVVQLPFRLRLTGTLAWLAWLALHLFYLTGNRNRVSALVNWTFRYLAWSGGSGMIVGDLPDPADPAAT